MSNLTKEILILDRYDREGASYGRSKDWIGLSDLRFGEAADGTAHTVDEVHVKLLWERSQIETIARSIS
jgi:hypothetical protein